MTTQLRGKLLGCCVMALSLSSGRAQGLDLSFRDHDGSECGATDVAALRTGAFVGTLTLEVSPPSGKLEYAWAFYTPTGSLINHSMDARTYYYVYKPVAQQRLIGKDDTDLVFAVNLPYGELEYPLLPIGDYKLKLWVGTPGAISYDATTGAPTAGTLASFETPVAIVDVPFGVHTYEPRKLLCSQVAVFRVVTSAPVAMDYYFELVCPDALGSLSLSQVMIPQGQTCSQEFSLTLGDTPLEAAITALRDDGTAGSSAMLLVSSPSFTSMFGAGDPAVPALDEYAYCRDTCREIRFGAGTTKCGDCAKTNPPIPPECTTPPNAAVSERYGAVCGWALTTDCEFFLEPHSKDYYRVGASYDVPCGETERTVTNGGNITMGLNHPSGASATVGATFGTSTTTKYTLFHMCCKLTFDRSETENVVQCRTIN